MQDSREKVFVIMQLDTTTTGNTHLAAGCSALSRFLLKDPARHGWAGWLNLFSCEEPHGLMTASV